TIDDKALVQAPRSLFKTGFFQDIQLGRDGNVLVVTVVERPSISSIEIEGNKAISKDALLKGLKQSGLAEGENFQHATLEGVR
ncbi:outer membrane protein assembly factor BamA, partial [Pseudomonas aeruginosa]